MNLNDLKRLDKLPHLSGFSLEQLITEKSLYEGILITTNDIKIEEVICPGKEVLSKITVSDDVRTLHDIFGTEKNVLLPCPYCNGNRPFKIQRIWSPLFSVRKSISSKDVPLYIEPEEYDIEIDAIDSSFYGDIYDGIYMAPNYTWNANELLGIKGISPEYWKSKRFASLCGNECKRGILFRSYEQRIDLECTLDCKHRIMVDFIVVPAIAQKLDKINTESTDYELAQNLYSKHLSSLLLIKVGQYPSLKDLQLFGTQKYKSILKRNYSEYTLALALYADGVGVGSFIYLRRILEHLVIKAYKELTKTKEYIIDENIFKSKSFNEKIDYLEKECGITIIPSELGDIRNRIYGVISNGVHNANDEECLKLFPATKYIIDSILETQIQQREKEKRLDEVKKRYLEV